MASKQEQCAESLAKKLGKKFGKCWRQEGGKNKAEIGCWDIDDNSTYGGSVIEEMTNESGGVKDPFGSRRRTPKNFCDATRFAEDAIDISKGKR